MANKHGLCLSLLRSAIADMRKIAPFEKETLSTTPSILGGYEVSGPDRFYYYASSACCSYSAKAEAIDYMLSLRGGV